MSEELHLFIEVCKPTIQEVINTISNLDDEDFNGNNGIESVSDDALEEGFDNDKDYTVDFLEKKYANAEPTEKTFYNIIEDYCSDLFLSSVYADYKVSCFVDNGRVHMGVAWIIDN